MEIAERNKLIIQGRNSLRFFVNNIFSASKTIFKDGNFIGGQHVNNIADYLERNKKTCRVSARDHFKSVSFYAHFAQKVMQHATSNLEAHYFSFSNNLAAYHTEKIKRAILSNPFFSELIDCKKSAESILKLTWDGEHFITLEPHGLLEFNRGIHSPLIYIDDPFQDPANKMNIGIIKKVNDIILTQILDMAMDELHIAGTPQTPQDFFFDEEKLYDFARLMQPAIISDATKEVLWPEWKNYEQLQAIKRNKGTRIFNQEYLVSPAYSEDSYLKKDEVQSVVNPALKNYTFKEWQQELARRKANKEETKNDIIAGLDIGKKRHPSHLVIFEKVGAKYKQLHSKYFDHVDYKDQLAYCDEAIDAFNIDFIFYDNTRGEFEGFEEAGQLPGEMQPVNFTRKRKFSMATAFGKYINNKQIELLDDRRQNEQLLTVDSDLNALETPEGHGESFFSISLIFAEMTDDEETEDKPEPAKERFREKPKKQEPKFLREGDEDDEDDDLF